MITGPLAGMVGVIIPESTIPVDRRGVPRLPGYREPPDWSQQIAVQLEGYVWPMVLYRHNVELLNPLESPSCPQCGGQGGYLGELDAVPWFRCIQCGWDFPHTSKRRAKKRQRKNPRKFSTKGWTPDVSHLAREGLRGWVIAVPGGGFYGPYATAEQARSRIGKIDSLGFEIEGQVVHVGQEVLASPRYGSETPAAWSAPRVSQENPAGLVDWTIWGLWGSKLLTANPMTKEKAIAVLGQDHVDWLKTQSDNVIYGYMFGAWQANNMENLLAYETLFPKQAKERLKSNPSAPNWEFYRGYSISCVQEMKRRAGKTVWGPFVKWSVQDLQGKTLKTGRVFMRMDEGMRRAKAYVDQMLAGKSPSAEVSNPSLKWVGKPGAKVLDHLTQDLTSLNAFRKFDNAPGVYMPVHVELIAGTHQGDVFAVSHTFVQEGDLMRDPEVTFLRAQHPTGGHVWIPLTFRQDPTGTFWEHVLFEEGMIARYSPHGQSDLTSFCNTWLRNIKTQQRLKV